MENSENKRKVGVSLLALDRVLETNIVSGEAIVQSDKKWYKWGDDNDYPEYITGLVRDCTTLSSVINGLVDYIVGDDVVFNAGADKMNKKGETSRDIVRKTARQIGELGGFAWQIIRNLDGSIGEIYVLPTKDVRTDKERQIFVYSEEWNRRGHNAKMITYPKFIPDAKGIASSVLYVSLNDMGTYPVPLFASATKSCEIERSIDDFHLNSLENGFMGSYVINFCNGMPEDEEKAQIERDVTEKLSGIGNAGRIFLNFADNKDSVATLEKLDVEDYGEKYNTLAQRAEGKIYASFRANPNLFGLPTAGSNGFNQEEYESAFKLFNRTAVLPIQAMITDAFDKVFGMKDSITITPFSMKEQAEESEDDAQAMLAVQIGVGGTQSLTAIIADPNLTDYQKEQLLIKLFNFTPEEAHRLFESSQNDIGGIA